MESGLAGRTAVVAGASQGIGRAVVAAFASEGMRVVMLARDAARLTEAATAIRSDTPDADLDTITADVTDRGAVDQAADRVRASHGTVHVVVNNAGNRMRPGRQLAWDDEDWLGDIDAKLLGMLRVIRAFDPLLPTDGSGRVVNVSGVAGSIVWETALTHGINNSAMNHATRYLATDLAPRRVTVNAVIPGLIATEWRHDWARDAGARRGITEEAFVDQVCRDKGILLGRWAEPSEVADAVTFLASDRAAYITGTTLTVDGGLGANAR
jgi:NAD(P)-dependent dehydrogenase (short-subunit alcohol dehydrogenase family)